MSERGASKGILYIVSTPIGNLGDITLRAIDTLKEVDLVAAEDTRRARKLFSRYEIKTRLVSYYGAKEEIKGKKVLEKLRSGRRVALISDAGTPGISDPGYYLIKNAVEEGHEILTIPGPSAIISALTLSGLPTSRFVFEGFLPPRAGHRRERLEALKDDSRTMVFYESPGRTLRTLRDMLSIFGDRDAALARELTKIHEEVVRGRISDIIASVEERGVKGEITIVLAGCREKAKINMTDIEREIEKVVREGHSAKETADMISRRFNISKRTVYQKIIKKKNDG